MIEFRNVSKVYTQGPRRVAALDDLSLTIRPGEFVVVTGPSGSGKSSLLHLAGGLDVPTEGQVIVDGREMRAMGDDDLTLFRRNRIGLVFQFFNLLPTLSVLENTALPALLSGGRFADVQPAAERLLTQVGLQDRMTHRPEELSGGEMQRVAIARALINDPPILLADEPTGNLDSATGAEILALLRQFHGERTLVIVTHDLSMERVADRSLHIRDGRLA
ncbi:MAG TPA: ABC transporter ATP-binding protein [Chthonomonadaceae bacterium]|nr:ABC transporter ATP-binding protein [Chthonomonadaceae bacterium]